MKKVILTQFILSLCLSLLLWPQSARCQQVADSPFKNQFKRSPIISDESGKPRNARTVYFPAERFIDSSTVNMRVPKDQVTESMRTDPRYILLPDSTVFERRIRTRIDTFKLNWFSYYLYKLEEPVLYNFPLNKEVYRFTWIRSFHPPVVISMEKQGDNIQLLTKMLRKIPELPGSSYSSRNGTIHVADTSARIPFKLNKAKRITKNTFEEFTQLIDKLNVLYSSPLGFTKSFGSDGSEWILETHRPDGYYFLVRWSPSDNQPIRLLGDYLLNLSDAKKETRY